MEGIIWITGISICFVFLIVAKQLSDIADALNEIAKGIKSNNHAKN